MKKVAVIGFGFMRKTHALNILKNKNLQLVAIVDKNFKTSGEDIFSETGNFSTGNINPEKIKKVHQYTSLDECFQSEQLDAVHICVHTDLHYEFARKALSRGLHVLIEKPFCLDVHQGEELISMAKEKGVILMVAHVVRFMPPYQKLKEWVDNGKYGKLKFLSLSRFSGVPLWGQWKDKQTAFGTSGGALFDLVVHDIDYAVNILGEPQKMTSFYLPGKLSPHDYINSIWDYADRELKVKIEGGNIFHSHFPFQTGFMASFEKASVCYSTLTPAHIFVSDDLHTEELAAGNLDEGYYNEIDYFSICMEENYQPVKCTPQSSLTTIKICYEHFKKA